MPDLRCSSWNEAFITIRWVTASWCDKHSCEKRYSSCVQPICLTGPSIMSLSLL